MARFLSVLAFLIFLLGLTGLAAGQPCPPATIGVYFDPAGELMTGQPVQDQNLVLYVILFVEAPVGGAAWRLEMTSPQYEGALVGPPGPNCQPPWCEEVPDPPFWLIAAIGEGAVVLGDPFGEGIRQGFGDCQSGFFGNPILLATVILRPWADILGSIEVDIAVLPEEDEGLVFADCNANLCFTVEGLTSHLGATVVADEKESWGAIKALYR